MLLQCIDSVQNLRNEPYDNDIQWEHIIYDDGSSDGTRAYFQKHKFPNTRYIYSPENKGISSAANTALAECRMDFILELDSDDIAPQRVLANFYHTAQEYRDTDWFVADFYRINATGEYIIGQDYYGWEFTDCKEILQAIFSGNHFIQHNVLYRRSLWEKVGGYDESLAMAEDLDLYVRFLLADHMPQYASFVSHFHRLHAGNVSAGVSIEGHVDDLTALYHKYEKELKNRRILPPVL